MNSMDELVTSNRLKDLIVSVMLGNSMLHRNNANETINLTLYLNEGGKRFFENYITSHKLNVSLISELSKTELYALEGEGVSEIINELLKVREISKDLINKNVILLWICLFAHYKNGSYLIHSNSNLNEQTTYNLLKNYIFCFNDAKIAHIENDFYFDNLENAFALTIKEKYPTYSSIRISRIMSEKESTTEHISVFRKIFRGEKLNNNVPYNI